MKRGLFVASSIATALAGCDRVTNSLNESAPVRAVLDSAEHLDDLVIGTHGMAKLYRERDISVDFRTNGNDTPSDATYQRLVADRFASYRLRVGGLVDHPATFDLRQLHALRPADADHAPRLRRGLEHRPVSGRACPSERFCSSCDRSPPRATSSFTRSIAILRGTPFYGSLSLAQAAHPQTQLALALNGKPLDPAHGAPVRLRVPTQLAYKSTKWVQRIELVASLKAIGAGRGGFWEDNGYAWYAGI